MADLNRVTLLGRSGADAELRKTQNGHPVLSISIATSKKKGQGEAVEWISTWHKVVIWGKRAEALAPVIKKGSMVLVQGELQSREYQDKDGNKRVSIEVVATEAVEVIQKSQATQQSSGGDEEIPW
jgi:single-strand DNA-binding protein